MLSGSFALIEVRTGGGGAGWLQGDVGHSAMWALMGPPASDGIQWLCCVREGTRSLLPSLRPLSSPFGMGGGIPSEKKVGFCAHAHTHARTPIRSVSRSSSHCALNGDMGKDASLNRYGGVF